MLRDTNTIFGAGALGLYGTDATGGAIDMETLDPTQQPVSNVVQGLGTLGRSFSALQATGTYGRLGYVLAGGTQGTSGNFAPQQITQTGLLSGDFSPNAYAANRYLVSGNSQQRDGLLKLQYTFAPGTIATITGYSAQSYQDKTGVGDNDYTPYSVALQNAQGQLGAPGSTCPSNRIQVTVTNAGGTACYTVAQYAAATTGPAGGGPDRFKFINNQDYHGRFVTNYKGQTISLDGFIDYYSEAKNSNLTGGPCNTDPNCKTLFPNATFYTGGFFDNIFKTTGFLVSDDIARGINDFGFGYYTQHQSVTGNVFGPPNYTLLANNPLFLGNNNIFMRDVFSPTPGISLFTNVWYKLLSTTGADTIDPRATLVLRPTRHDVIRLIAGKTDGEPAASLALQNLTTVFGSINVDCQTLVGLPGNTDSSRKPLTSNSDPVSVGQVAASNLNQETATDYEFSLGHVFNGGSSVQVAAYDQHEANIINTINVPIATGQIPGALLAGYFGRIRNLCGGSYVDNLGDLAASQAVNTTTSGLFRGLELSGRLYATPRLYFDATYDLQHAQLFGFSDAQLMSNPYTINGGQEVSVPLSRGTLSADYTTPLGIEARIDGYYYPKNNPFNRPSYAYADGFVTYQAPRTHTGITLGINNIFNSAADNYGRIGLGVQPPLNSFATAGPPAPPERYGLLTRSFLVTISQQVR